MEINLRAAEAEDEAFLYELYASTRAEEIAALSLGGWNATQQEIFLRMQFNAQRQQYAEFPNADHRIILRDSRPIGRLFVHRLQTEICLTDIALLPEYRGSGLGTKLIGDLLAEAALADKPVKLHVLRGNRARGLYERLGFTVTGDDGMYFEMEWRAVKGADG